LKISKKTWLIIAIGIFVIALAALYMAYNQQVSEQNQLNEQLALAQSRLSGVNPEKLSSQQAELEEQLSQATSQFEAVKTILSQPAGSITVTDTLFDIARVHGVEVTEMTSSGLTDASLEGVPCLVISVAAKVEGDVPNLVSFVVKLNSFLTTGAVESITITIPETDSGEKASADIQLVAYTYQGD